MPYKDKQKQRDNSKKWYLIHSKDPEWVARKTASNKRWVKSHREHRNEYARVYRSTRKEQVAIWDKRWALKKTPEELSAIQRFHRHGITPEQFNELRKLQDNKCAICHEEFTYVPRVDHDHRTGKVRGLLCRECNSGLGFFEDDSKRIEKAIAYLSRL